MKKTLAFIVFIAIVLVGVVTCPPKDAHQDALMKLVNVALDTELSKKIRRSVGTIQTRRYYLKKTNQLQVQEC